MRKNLLIITMCISCSLLKAQEFQAKVVVLAQQVGTAVDKSVFTTLQNQLTNFVNSRKWTTDVYQPQEKIKCNFILAVISL